MCVDNNTFLSYITKKLIKYTSPQQKTKIRYRQRPY